MRDLISDLCPKSTQYTIAQGDWKWRAGKGAIHQHIDTQAIAHNPKYGRGRLLHLALIGSDHLLPTTALAYCAPDTQTLRDSPLLLGWHHRLIWGLLSQNITLERCFAYGHEVCRKMKQICGVDV